MDAEPWTYQVMAKEMLREGRLEATHRPGDAGGLRPAQLPLPRARHDPRAGRRRHHARGQGGRRRWYTSHHAQNSWSIDRDGPAATTIELPAGTTRADVEAIKAIGVPTAATPPLTGGSR